MKSKILLLEDDLTLCETVSDYLEEEGFDVTSVYDGDEARDIIYEKKFDLFLFDVNVPSLNGFELLKSVREEGNHTPTIFITSLNSVDSLEEGFQSGCDDYIRKPFELKELLLRVQTIIKREFSKSRDTLIQIGSNTVFNTDTNELVRDGVTVQLNFKEQKLLKFFIQNMDELLTHERIYDNIWDYDEQYSDNSLRTYIKNLRKVLGKDKIVSLKKLGYRFNSK